MDNTITSTKPTTTDEAIARCEQIIQRHGKHSVLLYSFLFFITLTFVLILTFPLISNVYKGKGKTKRENETVENKFIEQLSSLGTSNIAQYDTLIDKAIQFQKLLNAKNESYLTYLKSTDLKTKIDYNDYIIYGIFIIIFAVITSLYRFHLKEISRQEHYLIGFQRIRIAGVNSDSKYNDEVKIALTKNAFFYEPDSKSKSTKKLESPIEGHPTSDLATSMINKILDKFEFEPKAK